MAIFRTRSSTPRGQEAAHKSNVPVDSVETLRTRARQRLIGAVVLVVLGVLGFSLLFDTQPRPIPVDIDISIPDKDKAERLEMPAAAGPTVNPSATVSPSSTAVAATAVAAATTAAVVAALPSTTVKDKAKEPANVQASASLSPKEEILTAKPASAPVATVKEAAKAEAKTEAKLEAKPEAKPEVKAEKKVEKKIEAKPEAKAEAKPEVKPAAKSTADDGAKAKAILEGKDPVAATAPAVAKASKDAADGSTRFIVQVGAFADRTKAHDVRVKLERAGLKTYTHVAQTPDGERTRVRVGPFAKRDEAEKAAAKIKTLDLPAAILTL